MTKYQLITTILALIIMAFLGSCSSEDFSEPDVLKVTPELRARIDMGMKLVPRSEKNAFDEKFFAFLNKCDEMGMDKTPYQYMETEEYKEFKEYMKNSSAMSSYLLMNRYLKRNPSFFSFILEDLMDSTYPGTVDVIADRMKSSTTVRESMDLYPQVCLEIWLDTVENH